METLSGRFETNFELNSQKTLGLNSQRGMMLQNSLKKTKLNFSIKKDNFMRPNRESKNKSELNQGNEVNKVVEQNPSVTKTELIYGTVAGVKHKFMEHRSNLYLTAAIAAIAVFMVVSCKKDVKVTSVTLDKTTLTLIEGETATLTATVLPDNAIDKSVTWTSSNPGVAMVLNGTVSAIAVGTTTVTVTTKDGTKTASCEVKVVDPKDPNIPMPGDVYIVGSVGGNATIWKNGIAHNLTDGGNWAAAYSVYVSDGNVYVAGEEHSVAKFWINGVGQNLPVGFSSMNSSANSVYVSGKDVYVAGHSQEQRGGQYSTIRRFAIVWKNGVVQDVSDGNKDAYAHSVYVAGSDVYVAGEEGSTTATTVATIWKNGVVQSLTVQGDNGAHSVCVSGNNVYVAGCEGNVAKLWKNGVAQDLTDGTKYANAYSVYVSGSDVYVAGNEGDVAKLWKNGVAQNLPSFFATKAYSVYVSGNDVYAVGWDSFDVKLWKNGKLQIQPNGKGTAYSVFVVK